MVQITKVKTVVTHFAATALLLLASLGAPLMASASADPGLKTPPVAPAPAANAITAPIASKDKAQAAAGSRAIAPSASAALVLPWTVSLSASSQSLWPTQYSTLTATTNQNVGPTPYYLSIYDQTSHSNVAICGTGTTCSASVTQASATTHYYIAYVSYYPSTNPPAGIQATSSSVYVTWKSVTISLQASPATTFVGGSATLTSTTSADIGPSPFYAEIYDATTGVRLTYCGFGTTCSVSTSQSVATTHRFVAYVSNYSTTYPPAGIRATSNDAFVTWNYNGYRIFLNAVRTSYGHDTVTAFTNVNVGPTPYWIEIFSQTTGARVAVCGSGTTCSANVALNFGKNNFVAFISAYSTTLPPANVQASSSIVSDTFFPIFVGNP